MTDTPKLTPIFYDDFLRDVRALAAQIAGTAPDFVIGIGRGGLTPAVYISQAIERPMLSIDHSAQVPGFADELLAKVARMTAAGTRVTFVDDINDSGATIAYIRDTLAREGAAMARVAFAVLIDNRASRARVDHRARVIDRAVDKDWFVFPWESVASTAAIEAEAVSVPERLG